MSRRWVFGLLAVAAVAGLVIAELATSGSGGEPSEAPPLPTQVLNGPSVDLASLRGAPALVNFWASWCAPCKEEAPTLDRFSKSLGHRAEVVGVDLNDTTSNASAFIRDHDLSYPILRDGSGSVATRYRVSGLPTTFVLDPQGQIVRTLRGPQTAGSLRDALQSVSSD
jgi:cytochrome c biogenesis protein CcmG/thiol:disulfide interchange protein DsbE